MTLFDLISDILCNHAGNRHSNNHSSRCYYLVFIYQPLQCTVDKYWIQNPILHREASFIISLAMSIQCYKLLRVLCWLKFWRKWFLLWETLKIDIARLLLLKHMIQYNSVHFKMNNATKFTNQSSFPFTYCTESKLKSRYLKSILILSTGRKPPPHQTTTSRVSPLGYHRKSPNRTMLSFSTNPPPSSNSIRLSSWTDWKFSVYKS